MVSCRVDTGDTINTSRETLCDVNCEESVDGWGVDTFEECELGGVKDGGVGKACNLFNNEMRVTNDVALGIELLWCGEVVGVRVDEVTSLKVRDSHGNIEGGVGLDGAEVRCGFKKM